MLRKTALVAAVINMISAAANAAPIEYVFTGVGNGTLGNSSFDGSFSVTALGDTSTIDLSGSPNINNAGVVG